MTKGFWRDDDERYLDAYWRRFPGVWHHGDLAYVDADGYWYLLGRSTTRSRWRASGSACPRWSRCCRRRPGARGGRDRRPDPVKGEVLVCFVVLHAGQDPGAAVPALQDVVTAAMGKAMAPSAIHVVEALPKTRNGKILRRVARASYIGAPPGDLTSIEDATVRSGGHVRTVSGSGESRPEQGTVRRP